MFTEDLSAFFSDAELAQVATLDGQSVMGMLEAGFEDATLAGYGIAGSSPRFTLPASQVPANAHGLLLTIAAGPGAGSYRVAQAMPDATGLVTLNLIHP